MSDHMDSAFQSKIKELESAIAARDVIIGVKDGALKSINEKLRSVVQEHEAVTSPAWVEEYVRSCHKESSEALSLSPNEVAEDYMRLKKKEADEKLKS